MQLVKPKERTSFCNVCGNTRRKGAVLKVWSLWWVRPPDKRSSSHEDWEVRMFSQELGFDQERYAVILGNVSRRIPPAFLDPPPQKPPNNLRVIGSFYGSIRSQSQHPTRTQVLVAALGLGYTGWNIIQSSARPSSILPLIETGFGTHFSHPFVALLCASSSHSACWFSITLNVNEVRTWNKKASQDSPKVRKEHTYGVPSAPTTNINSSPVLVLGCQTLHPGTS